jgi:hypothetical protein
MKWMLLAGLLAIGIADARADELHLRDGTVITGVYVGGTQKEVYFQHTPAGSDMYPLFMVESVRFNNAPGFSPGAASFPNLNSSHLNPAWMALLVVMSLGLTCWAITRRPNPLPALRSAARWRLNGA